MSSSMSFYQKQLFFCTNLKENGKKCCQQAGADELREYARQKLIELGIHGKGKNRVNMAGCMGRCADGPTMVVYPEGTWYSYKTTQDIDEIIENHILGGEEVTRLTI